MAKIASNEITGDFIKSRVNTKEFEANFDAIFRKTIDQQEPKCLSLDSAYERKTMAEGLVTNPIFDENKEWDEKRIDIVGSNGNEGLHYESDKK